MRRPIHGRSEVISTTRVDAVDHSQSLAEWRRRRAAVYVKKSQAAAGRRCHFLTMCPPLGQTNSSLRLNYLHIWEQFAPSRSHWFDVQMSVPQPWELIAPKCVEQPFSIKHPTKSSFVSRQRNTERIEAVRWFCARTNAQHPHADDSLIIRWSFGDHSLITR